MTIYEDRIAKARKLADRFLFTIAYFGIGAGVIAIVILLFLCYNHGR